MTEARHGAARVGAAVVVAMPLALVLLAGLASTPALAVRTEVADALAFAGGAVIAALALAIGAWTRAVPLPAAILGALAAGAAVVATSVLRAALVDAALIGLSHALGATIGRRVQHPGHLLPACAIAAAADLASVLVPGGPSHRIGESERALSWLAVQVPVPGAAAIAPVLGAGDLVFAALVLGTATRHELGLLRVTAAVLGGVLLAGAASAVAGAPVPALVAVAVTVVVAVPEARRVRPEDRRATHLGLLVAAGLVVAALARRLG